MPRFLKGQTAVEYMMTYAWALVAILAVIAVIFYVGVLKPAVVSAPSCDFPTGTSCIDFKLQSGTAYLSLKLGNNLPRRINVTAIKCTQEMYNPSTNWTSMAVPIALGIGEEKWVASVDGLNASPTTVCCFKNDGVTCYPNSAAGQPYSGKVWIQYKEADTGANRTLTGSINGPFE